MLGAVLPIGKSSFHAVPFLMKLLKYLLIRFCYCFSVLLIRIFNYFYLYRFRFAIAMSNHNLHLVTEDFIRAHHYHIRPTRLGLYWLRSQCHQACSQE